MTTLIMTKWPRSEGNNLSPTKEPHDTVKIKSNPKITETNTANLKEYATKRAF